MSNRTQKQQPVNPQLHRKRKLRPSILASSAAALLAISFFPSHTDAATFVYSDAGGSFNWGDGGNWVGGVAPSNGSDLQWNNGTGTSQNFPNPSAGNTSFLTNANSITFNAAATTTNWTLNGGALTIGAGGVTNNSTLTQTLSFTDGATGGITLGAGQTWSAAAGVLNVTSNVDLNGQTLTTAGGSNLGLSGTISGAGGLINNNTATVTITNAATFSTGVALNSGTLTATGGLTVSGGTLSGSGALNGSLNYTSTAISTFSGAIGDAGGASTVTVNTGVTSAVGGFLHLTGADTYTGATNVTSGQLFIGNAAALSGSGVTVSAGATLGIDGGITTATAIPLSIAGSGVTFGVPGVGALVGNTFNAGPSGYTGNITLAGNATIAAAGGTFNLAGTISLGANTVTFGTEVFGAGTISANGVISGTGGVIVDTQTTNFNASNTYTGTTTIINGGVLNANVAGAMPAPAADGGTGTVRSDVVMDVTGVGSTTASGTGSSIFNLGASQAIASLSGAASSTVNIGSAHTLTIGSAAGTTTFAGVISGAGNSFLIKDGASTEILTGTNTYTGRTEVAGGVLQIGDGVTSGSIAASTPVVVDAAGTLAIDQATGGSFTNDVMDNGTVHSLTTGTQTLSGNISGMGALLVDGAGGFTILSGGANAYQGGTTVGGGSTLQIGTAAASSTAGQNIAANGITLGSSGNIGTLHVFNVTGGTLANNITGGASGGGTSTVSDFGGPAISVTLSGTITDGAGKIQVFGDQAGATLILTNAGNTYSGATSAFSGGTLQIGTVAAGGSIGATSPVDVDTGGTLLIVNIGGPTANTLANNITNVLGGTGTVNVFSANNNTLSGTITDGAGTVALTQSGTGTTYLTNNGNTYSGTTLISAGTLQLGDATAGGSATGVLGTGAVTDNANLNFNRSNALTVGNNISGTGTVNQIGTGTTTLSGANTYTGATTVQMGILQLGSVGALGSAGSHTSSVTVSTGAELDLAGFSPTAPAQLNLNGTGVASAGALTNSSATAATYSGPVTLQSSSSIGSSTGDITLNNTVSGASAASLTKIGTKTLFLTGVNSYAGMTLVTAGILNAGSNSALGVGDGTAATGTTVSGGATLQLATGVTIGNEALNITGTGFNAGAGTLGALATTGGTATYGGPITLVGAATISADGGTLTLTGGINKNGVDLTLGGGAGSVAGGTINIKTVGISGAAANSDMIVDSTTVNEDVANSYNGKTIIRSTLGAGSGILNTGVASALPTGPRSTVVMDDSGMGGSTLNIAGTPLNPAGANQSIASLDGAASSKVTLGANTLTIGFGAADPNGNAAANFAGVISGTGGLTKDETSTQILSGPNTYTGATTVNGGVLQAGVASVPATPGLPVTSGAFGVNSAVTIGAAGTLDLAGFGNTIGSLAGASTTGIVQSSTSAATLATGSDNTSTTFGGVLQNGSGTLSLTKVGTGTQTLGVAGSTGNSYTGATMVINGKLQAGQAQNGANGAFGASSDTTVGTAGTTAILELNGFNNTIGFLAGNANGIVQNNSGTAATLTLGSGGGGATFAGVVQDGGAAPLSITKIGAGTEIFSGMNTYTGATTVSAGVLQAGIATDVQFAPNFGAFGVDSAVTVNGTGTLDLAGFSNSIGSLSDGGVATGTVTNSAAAAGPATLTTGLDNTNTTFSGLITDAGAAKALGLTKAGTGTFTLTGANSYNGVTNVVNGILNIQNATALGAADGTAATNTVVAGGATLQVQGGIAVGNEALTLNGTGFAGQTGALVNTGGTNTWGGQVTLGSASTISSDTGTLIIASGLPIVGGGNALTLAGASGTAAAPGGFIDDVINASVASVTKNGAGTWQIGGAGAMNTYTGPTTVNAGVLQAGSTQAFGVNSKVTLTAPLAELDLNGFSNTIGSLTGVPGSIVDTTGGSATLTTGAAGSTTFAGTIQNTTGLLTLSKVGATTFILTGANTYGGSTFVNAGVLQVDGSIASPNTFVANGAQLQGIGFIGGNVFNHGTVKPGDSPGTLTVGGSYTQYGDGNLRIELASTSNYGKLKVGGVANLNGTITAVSVNGFQPRPGNVFTVVTANGGVNGKFSTFNDQSGARDTRLLKFSVVYDPHDVYLEFTQEAFVTALNGFRGRTPNEIAVARDLDRALFDKRLANLIDFLDNHALPSLPHELDLIAPEEMASVYNTAVSLANVQSFNLQRRTEDLRMGASGFSASGFHMAGTGPNFEGAMSVGAAGPNGSDGKDMKESKTVLPPEARLGVFLTGVGEWVNVGSDFNSQGAQLDTGGFTLGVDYKVTPNFAVGLMAGYAHTSNDMADGVGRIAVDGGKLGLYATYFTGGFYVDTAVSGGYNSYSTKRLALGGDAFGDTDGGELNVLFGTGYTFHAGGLSFGPTGTFQYTYVGLNSFTEHGSLAPLSNPGQSQDSVRTSLGGKASYDWKAGGILIRPELSLAWQHEYGDTAYAWDSQFASGAGGMFTVHGPEIGRDSLLLGAGVAVQWNDRTSTYVYYDGEYGRTNYDVNSVSGGVRLSF